MIGLARRGRAARGQERDHFFKRGRMQAPGLLAAKPGASTSATGGDTHRGRGSLLLLGGQDTWGKGGGSCGSCGQ